MSNTVSNTVRGYLQDQLTIEQVRPLEADFNRALSHRALNHQLPRWLHRQLWHRGLEVTIDFVAIDFHDAQAAPFWRDSERWFQPEVTHLLRVRPMTRHGPDET
jgi:CHAD domain-containing protein